MNRERTMRGPAEIGRVGALRWCSVGRDSVEPSDVVRSIGNSGSTESRPTDAAEERTPQRGVPTNWMAGFGAPSQVKTWSREEPCDVFM
jgi:hypothetical protein